MSLFPASIPLHKLFPLPEIPTYPNSIQTMSSWKTPTQPSKPISVVSSVKSCFLEEVPPRSIHQGGLFPFLCVSTHMIFPPRRGWLSALTCQMVASKSSQEFILKCSSSAPTPRIQLRESGLGPGVRNLSKMPQMLVMFSQVSLRCVPSKQGLLLYARPWLRGVLSEGGSK